MIAPFRKDNAANRLKPLIKQIININIMAPPLKTINNPNGRPKGSPNKSSFELREKIKIFLSSNFDNMQAEYKKLDGLQKLTFYERLIKYVVPIMNNNEVAINFEQLTESELDEIINRLLSNNAK
jgi:hypothetical protein